MGWKKETFDAVEMVRRVRDRHYEETKDLTNEQQVAFYREKARRLREERSEREAPAAPAQPAGDAAS